MALRFRPPAGRTASAGFDGADMTVLTHGRLANTGFAKALTLLE
jgi:hypothetical protein